MRLTLASVYELTFNVLLDLLQDFRSASRPSFTLWSLLDNAPCDILSKAEIYFCFLHMRSISLTPVLS